MAAEEATVRSPVLLDLLGEVIALPRLLDQRELSLDPVGVLLLGLQDRFQQLAAAPVPQGPALLDAGVEGADGRLLDLEVEPELLGHRLADVHLAQPLE